MTEYTSQMSETTERKKPNYVAIFAMLALITLIEVTVARHTPVLLVALSFSKVALVALYYMHLKFETGWFTAIFLTPLPLVALIIVALIVALTPGAEGSAAIGGVCSFW